jgi:hypothetical protein
MVGRGSARRLPGSGRRSGLDGAKGVAAIADGRGDFMPNIGKIPGSDAAYVIEAYNL